MTTYLQIEQVKIINNTSGMFEAPYCRIILYVSHVYSSVPVYHYRVLLYHYNI